MCMNLSDTLNKVDTPPPRERLPRAQVGNAIRELRKSRRITIEKLAKALDRSAGYISQLERGISQPTLKDLYAACTVFNVTMSWFLDMDEPQELDSDERDFIVRASRRRALLNGGTRTELLTPHLDHKLEFMLSTFAPLVETEVKNVATTGAEYGMILKGTLELWIGERKFVLGEGDSYKFDRSSIYHSRNPSQTEETVIIWAGSYV